MSPQARRRVAISWRVLLALSGIVATALLAGAQLGFSLPLPRDGAFWVVVAVAAITAADNVRGSFRQARSASRGEAVVRVNKALTGLLVEVAERNQVWVQDLGASVFVPRTRLAGWWFRKTLVRVVRFRLDDYPQATKVEWLPGKGAVGKCWETQRLIYRDWRPQREQHGRADLTRAQFEQIPPEESDGFSYEEFLAIAAKYREVSAVPVVSVAGDIVGVISIDVAGRAEMDQTLLADPKFEEQAHGAAALIRDDLSKLEPLA